MHIRDIQDDAQNLGRKHNWTDRDPSQRFRYLISELGELSRELLRLEWGEEDLEQVKRHIAYEMYDIVWNVCDLANQLDIDLEQHFSAKRQYNQERSWPKRAG